jgi:hypothetical protein
MKHTPFPQSSLVTSLWVTLTLCLSGTSGGGKAEAQVYEVPPPPELEESQLLALNLPQQQGGDQVDGGGFFPTLSETALLRGPYDARSYGGSYTVDSPDRIEQNATDIFPYQDPVPNFYQRNERFFRPLDQFFGFLTPFDTLTVENDRLRNVALSVDANLGILTRAFSHDQAMVKAGPLYLDVLWVGAGVLWSDFSGLTNFQEGDEDGWTGYIELGIRLAARITDSIYLTAGANLIYLPFENELAFRALTGELPGAALSLVYSDDLGAWDVSIFNYFQGRSGLNFAGQLNDEGIDRAGRYWFGIQQERANEFYDEDGVFFTNTLGVSATRLVLNDEWRYWVEARHLDFWGSFDFDDHRVRDQLSTWLGYEGSDIPFAPRFFYDVWDFDGAFQGSDVLLHRVGAAFTGRITENINWEGDIGYMFGTGDADTNYDSVLWNIGLSQAVSEDFTHFIRFGQGLFFNDLQNQALMSRYLRYGFDHRLGQRSSVSGFVQYADEEYDLVSDTLRERYGAGATLSIYPLDFTAVNFLGLWEQTRDIEGGSDGERWIGRVELSQRLGLRLSGQLFYQYEDNDGGPGSFTEHVTGLSLRRYF